MLDLSAIASTPREVSIVLGRVPVTLRAITAAELDALKRALPRPGPEMVPNPIIGAEPKLIPDTFSPAYRAALDAWETKMMTAIVAAAAGVTVAGIAYRWDAPTGELRAYLDAVVPAIRNRFTETEIQAAYDAVGAASDPVTGANGEDLLEAAKKNLSAHPDPHAAIALLASHFQSRTG